jgi:cobalt-zinc-cadmium efflux system outer membrane protein
VRFALGCAFTLSGLVADDAIAQTSGRSVSATRPRYATDTSMRSPNSLPRLVRQPSQIPPVGKQVSSSSSYQPADSLNQPAGQPAGQPAAQPPSPPTKELPAEKLPAEKLPAEKLPAEKLPAESVPSTPLAPPRPPRDTGVADEAVPPPRPQRGDVRLDGALLLSEAEQIAVAQHPALVEAQARIQAAQGQWLQAGLYPNPIVGYSGQQLGSRGQAEQQGVVVQGDLVLGGKLRLNRAVAEQQIVQAEMEFAGRQLRVLTNVRKSFYEVLVAQRRVDLNDQLVSVGAKGLQAAETLFQAKEVGRADVLQARIEAQQSRILQFNARNRAAAAWRELAAAMGREDLGSRPVEGDVSDDGREYDWEPMRQRLLGSSPEVAVALANAQRAQAALARARVEPIPTLTIQGIVQRDASLDSTNGAIQATMPIPIFNRNQGNIRAAEGEWIAAEQAVRRLELDLQSRLAPVFERYRNAKQQVERYREDILPNAKETLDLIQASYEAGESNYLALLTAQRTYFQTNLAYLDALRELWSAIWEMEGLLVTP